MSQYENKIDNFIFKDLRNKKSKNFRIGVRFGISTKRFLNLIDKNGGHLFH